MFIQMVYKEKQC
uniref:Uncharacterized protein n=1 Tax=Anguilla anguilla TaxID=7936 RepID=A0A0E9XT03_ANGAN